MNYADFFKEELRSKSIDEIRKQVNDTLMQMELDAECEGLLTEARDKMIEASLEYMVAIGVIDSYDTEMTASLTKVLKQWEDEIAQGMELARRMGMSVRKPANVFKGKDDDDVIARFLKGLK